MKQILTFKNFSLLFIAFLIIEMCADIFLESRWGLYLTKPLLMPLLIIWAKLASNRQNKVMNLLYAGLFFSMWGDIFLMFRNEAFFIFGLGSFLIAHICYIWMFITEISLGNTVTMNQKILRFLPFSIFFGGFMAYILPSIAQQDANMIAPVIVYALTITIMGYTASLRSRCASPSSYAWVLMGALAFTISDSCIAINKFIEPIPYPTLPIMTLYGIGQLLITAGILLENNKVDNFK